MAESIPLRARLCVHVVNIIVSHVLSQSLDLMLEDLSAEGWLLWDL